MHRKKGIVHLDLNLDNILLDVDYDLKIADFGLSENQHINQLTSFKGSKSYIAPEIFENKTYNGIKVDTFTIGVILFIIVEGKFPFNSSLTSDPYYKLLKEGRNSVFWKDSLVSAEFKNLIERMVNYNPNIRPSLEEIINHPWYKKPINK